MNRAAAILLISIEGWEKTLNTPGKMHDHNKANCPACALRDEMRAVIVEMGGKPS